MEADDERTLSLNVDMAKCSKSALAKEEQVGVVVGGGDGDGEGELVDEKATFALDDENFLRSF